MGFAERSNGETPQGVPESAEKPFTRYLSVRRSLVPGLALPDLSPAGYRARGEGH